MAQALARLGVDHALVVHGKVGMDEISPVGETDVWEVRNGRVDSWTIAPGRHGLEVPSVDALRGGEPKENAGRLERLLDRGDDRAGRAAVLLNAGAAVYVAGLVSTFEDGLDRARAALESGDARAALERLRRASPSTSG
jgi:anthranilate phosphoribosyltransferase